MEIQLSQEQIQGILDASMPDIKKAVINEVVARTQWCINDVVADELKKTVREFIQQEIIPDVKSSLMTEKQNLAGIAANAAPQLAEAVGQALGETLKEKLEKSWDRKKIFEALFS